MKTWKRKNQNTGGQAAVEFLIVVVVVFFFLLFYLSFSITLIASDYVDYATFMAARTYKSGHVDSESQEEAARRVFNQYMAPLDTIIKSPKLNFTSAGERQTEGVSATYDVDLFYLPPLFVKDGDKIPSRLTLTSESLLGRDPSQIECLGFFERFVNANGLGVGQSFLINLMDDNGC